MVKKTGTIRDVAKKTGLSTATVSRVMNGALNFAPETRARVIDAARDLNYLPNPAARALSTRRTRTIATIIPTVEHSVYAKFVTGLEQALAAKGYSLVMSVSRGSQDTEVERARNLLGMGAEGFVLSGATHSPDLTRLFDMRQVPCLYTSVWQPDNPVPTIGYDNAHLARDAVEFLAEQGHRKIAILHGLPEESDRTRARISGAKGAAAGLTLGFFEAPIDVTGGKVAARKALQDTAGYTALLCFSDVLALGAYFAAREAGLSIPYDLSVMGFDNLDWSADATPPLTTIDLPARDMGTDAARQIMARIDKGTPITPRWFDAAIIERGSVRAL